MLIQFPNSLYLSKCMEMFLYIHEFTYTYFFLFQYDGIILPGK